MPRKQVCEVDGRPIPKDALAGICANCAYLVDNNMPIIGRNYTPEQIDARVVQVQASIENVAKLSKGTQPVYKDFMKHLTPGRRLTSSA